MSLSRQIQGRIAAELAEGRTPQIVLDLDGTLFDNRIRTKQILVDVARLLLGAGDPVSATIADLAIEAMHYNPADTLRAHGVTDDDLLVRIREAWADRFFAGRYLGHDVPYPGAVEATRSWWERGAEITYLSGRDQPRNLVGSTRSLREASFPLGVPRTHLVLKPNVEDGDARFKVEALGDIARGGPVVLIVENEPRGLNAMLEAMPGAMAVLVDTLRPMDSPTPADGVVRVGGMRDLLGGE